MHITELFGDRADILYTYRLRGTDIPAPPNATGEDVDVPWFDRDCGRLFRGEPIAFSSYPLMDGGIDLILDLRERYFIDHITMQLVGGSSLGGLDILDEGGRLIARALPEKTNTGYEFTIAVGAFAERMTLRFHGAYSHFGIKTVSLYAATGLEDTVYPLPTSVTYGEELLPFTALDGITVETELASGAAAYLAERMADELSVTLPKGEGNIRFAAATREDDGYTLTVKKDGVTITAAYPRAFFYAVASLLQLAREGGFGYAEIDDTPMMALRGVHVALPHRRNLPFLYRLVRELLVPMRYNTVILQLSGAMQYLCYPRINEMWVEACRRHEAGEWPCPAHYGSVGHDILTHDEIRALCAHIRSFGLEIVPEVQSLSHAQYITTAFPELAETKKKVAELEVDQKVADIPPADFYPHNMCPRHPDYYRYIFAILDEVIEVIRPERYVHIGHDEAYDLGSCPLCEGHMTEVFVEEVTRLHDHIRDKGLSTMMWSDMIHPGKDPYLVPEAAPLLPKDILMLDFTWYFNVGADIEDEIIPNGYPVAIGNMYSSHYPRFETRARKPGMVGAQVSAWAACEENSYGYRGKMYDFVYTATMMWNPGYDSAFRLTYCEIIKPHLERIRRRIGELPQVAADKPLALPGRMEDVPPELLFHSPAREALRLSPARCGAEVTVGKQAELIEILHATDRTSLRPIWEVAITIGEYVLVYEDGSQHCVPVKYSENIMPYRYRYGTPIPTIYYRHYGYPGTYLAFPVEGKDAEGRDYTLLRYPVKNPYPEKKIEKILCRHAGNTDAEILIFEIKTN